MKQLVLLLLLFSFVAKADNAQIIPNGVNLYGRYYSDIMWKSPSQIKETNLKNYKDFLAQPVDKYVDYERAKYLPKQYAIETLNTLQQNPVVSSYAYSKYDPKSEGIGFCFGRAMFAHLELVQRGLDRDSIKKAFVVGPMQTNDGNKWGWHVATIAQSKDANGNKIWLAIDPITGVMDVELWYERMLKEFSTDQKLKFYIGENTRVGINGVYDEVALSDPFYNNYFKDMMEWFDQESRTTDRYKTPIVGLPDANCDRDLMGPKTPRGPPKPQNLWDRFRGLFAMADSPTFSLA